MRTILAATAVSALVMISGPAMAGDGEAVYGQACHICHAAGIAGAPKLGDQAAWADRIAQDSEAMYQHAINGFQGSTGVMPPKGGFTHLSDDQVKAAVDFMVSKAK